jgi:hypothetical protein
MPPWQKRILYLPSTAEKKVDILDGGGNDYDDDNCNSNSDTCQKVLKMSFSRQSAKTCHFVEMKCV